MRIGKTRLENKSLLVGMGVMLGLMVLPKISEPVISLVTQIRDKIGGRK